MQNQATLSTQNCGSNSFHYHLNGTYLGTQFGKYLAYQPDFYTDNHLRKVIDVVANLTPHKFKATYVGNDGNQYLFSEEGELYDLWLNGKPFAQNANLINVLTGITKHILDPQPYLQVGGK